MTRLRARPPAQSTPPAIRGERARRGAPLPTLPDSLTMGRWLIAAGVGLVVIGLVVSYAPWLVSWFGRLPGDIRIETENSKVFIPITSMLALSAVVSLVLYLFRR